MLDQKMITFLEVVRLGSFTAASSTLFVTQPAVSQQIRRLEEHYGCSLIEHTGRSFTLTAQGEQVYTLKSLTIYS
jgi:DNA-binding transcriptional LysR family regulator